MVLFEKVEPKNEPKVYNLVIYLRFERSGGYNHFEIWPLMLKFEEFVSQQGDPRSMYRGLIPHGMTDQEVIYLNKSGQTRKGISKFCASNYCGTHFYTHLKVLSDSLKRIGYFITLFSKLQESYFFENHRHARFFDYLKLIFVTFLHHLED